MELDIRKRIFIIVGVVAGLVGALLLLIAVLRDRAVSPDAAENQGTPESGQVATPPARPAIPAAPPGDPEEIYLKQLSRIFVERFQSYSNQNDNQHIEDVLPIVTARMETYVRSKEQRF